MRIYTYHNHHTEKNRRTKRKKPAARICAALVLCIPLLLTGCFPERKGAPRKCLRADRRKQPCSQKHRPELYTHREQQHACRGRTLLRILGTRRTRALREQRRRDGGALRREPLSSSGRVENIRSRPGKYRTVDGRGRDKLRHCKYGGYLLQRSGLHAHYIQPYRR